MVEADCRVLTWNLWWRFGDWTARQPAIDDVIAATGADVVALQEAYRRGSDDQPERLAAVAGLNHRAWSPNRAPQRWRTRVGDTSQDLECGLAVLSRWPIVEEVDVLLPAGEWPSDGRTALGVVVDHPRGRLPVVTSHLDSHHARSRLRIEQLGAVARLSYGMAERAGLDALAPIVCGDLNAEPESDEVRRFCGVLTDPFIADYAFQDAWRIAAPDDDPGWTWRKDNDHVPDGNPNARIDYVFVGMAGRVASVRLVGLDGPVGLGTTASDHAGLVADLRP